MGDKSCKNNTPAWNVPRPGMVERNRTYLAMVEIESKMGALGNLEPGRCAGLTHMLCFWKLLSGKQGGGF